MLIKGQTFDEERAPYGLNGAEIEDCLFDGPADGESALKEAKSLALRRADFRLRYPLWHVTEATLSDCRMTDTCRAPLWYDADIVLDHCRIEGPKALRECDRTAVRDTEIRSDEFGWFCRDLTMENSSLISEYPFLKSEGLRLHSFKLEGKYSFQYVKNALITDSVLLTKDAFWHSENVTVVDSVVRGEYLGWYSKDLRLVRCRIIGTQPLCYAEGLVLEDCETEGCDLAFELSTVDATVKGEIVSVKNPRAGHIVADRVGEIIFDHPEAHGKLALRER